MSSFLLICAVVASLAVGVLMAQGLCVLMFEVFRIRATRGVTTTSLAVPTKQLESLQS